jgi:hypothetical protein
LGTHWEQDEPTPPCPPLRQGKKKFNLMERVGFFIPNLMERVGIFNSKLFGSHLFA